MSRCLNHRLCDYWHWKPCLMSPGSHRELQTIREPPAPPCRGLTEWEGKWKRSQPLGASCDIWKLYWAFCSLVLLLVCFPCSKVSSSLACFQTGPGCLCLQLLFVPGDTNRWTWFMCEVVWLYFHHTGPWGSRSSRAA